MTVLWWHWLTLGLILIGLELVIPAFTIIWFGLGAVVVSIIVAVLPGYPIPAQLLTWCVTSVAFTVAWFRFFNRRGAKSVVGSSKGTVLGEVGLITRATTPYAKGTVRFHLPVLGADEWQCVSEVSLQAGDRVRVVDVEGHVMKVEKIVKGEH